MLVDNYSLNLRKRWTDVNAEIKSACQRVGRDYRDVMVLAVSKTFPYSVVETAAQSGITNLGENYIQDCLPKMDLAEKKNLAVNWHFIGHLQTNKVKYYDHRFAMLHSLDSLKLARALSRHAVSENRQIKALVQVNIAADASKHGVGIEAIEDFIASLRQYPNLSLCGLMTIPAMVDDSGQIRAWYRRLAKLFRFLKNKYFCEDSNFRHLSMGMSNDYLLAVEEGATIVRLGRRIFGSREK